MHRSLRFGLGLVGTAALVAACSAGGGGNNFTNTAAGGGGNGAGAGGNSNGSGAGEVIITSSSSSGSTSSGGTVCNHPADVDGDADGWTTAEGDCNDCDPNVNPGALEVVAEDANAPAADEDCDGQVDNVGVTCDDNLAVGDSNPLSAARAVELCNDTEANPADKRNKKWGVISARWTLPDGAPAPQTPQFHLGHGMLPALGPNVHVQAGQRMLGLSSGSARQPTDSDYEDVGGYDKGYECGNPTGFPKESPACPGTITGEAHDGAGVELVIRVPTNATGFSFDFNFFTYEWPGFVCSTYNDFFVAMLQPIPMGQSDGNISFDKQGNPVSVNNAFVEVCGCDDSGGPPCFAGGKTFSCSLGNSGLVGTGFGGDSGFGQDHASTGWLNTKAPAKGGENITIRWTVYDSGDGILDTTTLVDNWQWVANGGTVTVGTDPIGTPK